MGGSSKQTIGQRYFAKLTTFIGNPIEKLIGINFDNRGWLFKPDNDESFLRVESPNLYGDKEGGVAGFIDIHTGTADQLPNSTYEKDFPKVSGYPFQSYLVFRGLGKKPATSGGIGQFTQGSPKHYNGSFYHGNSGYMKEMLLWPQRIHVRNDGRPQWYDEKAEIPDIVEEFDKQQNILFKTEISVDGSLPSDASLEYLASTTPELDYRIEQSFGTTGFNIEGIQINAEFSAMASGLATLSFEIESLKTSATEISVNNIVIHRSEVVEDNQLIETKKYVGIAYFNDFSIKCIATPDSNNQATLILKNISFSGYKSWRVEKSGINPIHKIREILTDDTAMNKPESDVNDANFKKAADVLFEENIGISWSVTEKSCLEAINELCGHIEAGVRVNRQTGLYEMVLFRDDWFDDDEIHTLPINKIKSMQLDGATSADELINKLNVSYYNREAIKNSSFSVAEIAAIRNLKGRENSEDVKFPYFMNQRNAVIVAQWKLKQMSTPVWQGTLTTGFYEARKWNRYDLLRLAWPKKWSGTILVRIMKINLGTGVDVSIDFVEVVPYSSNLSSSIGIDTPVDTTPKPPQPALFKAFELSYLEAVQINGQKAVDEALAYNPEAGYAAVVAKRSQSNSLNALMYTDTGNDYERTGTIQYCETAALDQNISQLETSFIVKNAGAINMVNLGTQITINNEIMVYQSYDDETGLLTVKRGALDTIPQTHLAGSVLYFADDFITVDPTEYVTGEIINVKTLTTTPSGILSLNDVVAQQVEIKARAIRPYPPANVRINGEYFPKWVIGDAVIAWDTRNRIQQTGGEILGWFDGSVSLESGTIFNIKLLKGMQVVIEHEGYLDTTIDIAADQLNGQSYQLRIEAVRDGYASMQIFEHEFLHRMTADRISKPYDLIVSSSENSINLAWKADSYISTIDYYNIYRHTQPFDGSDVASLLIASNVIDQSYEDKTALSGTHYYYRIEAVVEQTAEEQGVVSMSDEMVDAIKPIPLSAPYNLIVSVSDI